MNENRENPEIKFMEAMHALDNLIAAVRNLPPERIAELISQESGPSFERMHPVIFALYNATKFRLDRVKPALDDDGPDTD